MTLGATGGTFCGCGGCFAFLVTMFDLRKREVPVIEEADLLQVDSEPHPKCSMVFLYESRTCNVGRSSPAGQKIMVDTQARSPIPQPRSPIPQPRSPIQCQDQDR